MVKNEGDSINFNNFLFNSSMKRLPVLFAITAAIAVFCINRGYSQPSKGGTPPSFLLKSKITNTIDERDFPAIDVSLALAEDAARPGPLWAGRSIPVGLDMN